MGGAILTAKLNACFLLEIENRNRTVFIAENDDSQWKLLKSKKHYVSATIAMRVEWKIVQGWAFSLMGKIPTTLSEYLTAYLVPAPYSGFLVLWS